VFSYETRWGGNTFSHLFPISLCTRIGPTRNVMMDKKQIVILGGGYAGVHAAKALHKAFKKQKDKVEITLIDKNS